MNRIVIVLTALLLAGCTRVERPKTTEFLSKRYVDVVNAKNETGLRNLLHPDCLSKLSPLQDEFMNDILTREFRRPIPQKHTVSVSKLETESEPFSEMVVWRVKPTHQMQIDFSKGQLSGVTIVRFLRETKEGWCIVLPVPNDENLKKYKKKKESQQD